MTRKFIILAVAFLFALIATAKEELDSSYQALYHTYRQLYNSDSVTEFYDASAKMQHIYMENGDIEAYYTIRHDEILYDARRGEVYNAIKKANKLLEDMKNSKFKSYEHVYVSLGTIFETSGNYRMALYYYQEALNNTAPTDSARLAHIYSQLASLNFTRDTRKAWLWNERLASITPKDSPYYKSYIANKGQIYFYNGDKNNFFITKQEYDDYLEKSDTTTYNYGEHVLNVLENAFNGQYEEALRLLEQDTQDYDNTKRYDIRIHIYEMMGLYELALKEVDKRKDLRDSLNNELLFNNINEMSASAGIVKVTEETNKEREFWLGIIIILLFVAIGLMISRYFVRRRYQRKMEKQNKKLEIALNEVKKSDRMKGIFIQQISHEIRTPLNIINGYIQIIANPEMELEEKERASLMKEINQNTIAITDIIDDLLEMSQKESKERYRKDDKILVNALCRHIIEEAETNNTAHLNLCMRSNLPENFTIQSNEEGIKRILRQLLNNAIKFTSQGHIELSVSESTNDSADNIQFAVTDTGIGIPVNQHEKVFERFYKIDSFKQGLGIGLPMSRNIAVRLGGTLTIDKKYRDGTRMILSIPVK